MILTLPRSVKYLRGEGQIPLKNPLFTLSPIRDGILIINNQGKVVGQALRNEIGVTVTVAECGSVNLIEKGDTLLMKPTEIILGKGEKMPNENMKKNICAEMIFFGNYKEAQYEIFLREEGVIRPRKLMQVVAHPLNEKLVNINISEGENILLAVILCQGVGLFELTKI